MQLNTMIFGLSARIRRNPNWRGLERSVVFSGLVASEGDPPPEPTRSKVVSRLVL